MKKILCFGPGPIFKGGISNYNVSLAKAFDKLGDCEVHIVSWTQQYPAIIPRDFKDRKSKTDLLEGTNIQVHYMTNFNRPSSWKKTYRLIRDMQPDKVIFQWAIALQGIPMGYIAKKLRKHTDIEIIFDLHFVIQKENSKTDRYFTRRGIQHAHTYVVHARKTFDELQQLFPNTKFHLSESHRTTSSDTKTVLKLFFPVLNMFTPDPTLDIGKLKLEMSLNRHVFLFFGFIRKYKGLHNAIAAFAKVTEQRKDVSLIIAGEAFWNTLDKRKFSTRLKKFLFGIAKKLFLRKSDDEQNYRPLEAVEKYGIQDYVYQHIDFIPNEDVHTFFQVSNAVVLFYEYATPSGVESLSYNFRLPVLATAVGHFPETIRDGYNGYLAEPGNIKSMTEAMLKAIQKPIPPENVAATAENMSWENYAKAILG
jgi:glycosyltransferase involved in cell wall biosynthesis